MTKRDTLTHTLLFISLTELIMMLGSLQIMEQLLRYAPYAEGELGEFYLYGTYYFLFSIPILICLLYMRFTDKKVWRCSERDRAEQSRERLKKHADRLPDELFPGSVDLFDRHRALFVPRVHLSAAPAASAGLH